MSDKMTEAGRSVSVNRCIMESSITIPFEFPHFLITNVI